MKTEKRMLTKEDIGKTFVIDFEQNGILKEINESGVYFDFKTSVYKKSGVFKDLVGFNRKDLFLEL